MEREVLAEFLAEGLSLEQIGARVGKHASTVAYWVDQHGLAAAHRDRHVARGALGRDELTEVVALDLTTREIAARVSRSQGTVRHWLGRYGLKTTAAARRQSPKKPPGREVGHCRTHGETTFVVRAGSGGAICMKCRADAVTRWRQRSKRTLVEEAGGACALCGYDRWIGSLHFHHLDPGEKRFGLGSRGLARALVHLREEAAKCVLLCANCLGEVEGGLHDAPRLTSMAPAADVS